VKSNGKSYSATDIPTSAITTELGGTIPVNPCTGAAVLGADYGLTQAAGSATIQPAAGSNCTAGDLPMITLSQ